MQSFVERNFRGLLIIIWLFGCVMLFTASRTAIAEWRMGDPDDQMRLLQIRDWMSGQSWWDITQYRMNPPSGGPMHWSRLVDVPVATVIVLLRPLLGLAAAEHLAVVIVPLMTYGVVLALYASTARRLFGRSTALVAAFLFLTIIPAIMQVRPMRIDHHGWQLALFFWACLNMFDRRTPVRAAIYIGVALALWIEISIEGLPFAAIMLGILGLRWLMANGEEQSSDNLAFPAALGSMAVMTFGLYSVTEDWSDFVEHCDSLSPFHVAVFAVVAIILAVATAFKVRTCGRSATLIGLGAMAIAGSAAVALALQLAPQCGGDAFGQLDPMVRKFWFNRVPEGLPLWSVQLDFAIQQIAGLVAGSIALAYLLWRPNKLAARDRLTLVLLFLGTAMVGSFVSRTTVYALCLGTIMLAAMAIDIFVLAEKLNNAGIRIAIRLVAVFLAMPSLVGQNVMNQIDAAEAAANPAKERKNDMFDNAALECQKLSSAKALNRLPQSVIMIGLDNAPAILQMTKHQVIATGHHRNATAMADVIRTFTGPTQQAEKIIRERQARYLVICDGSFELAIYEKRSPSGFLGSLRRGQVPSWLSREADIGPFQIFRIEPEASLPKKVAG